MIGAGLDRQQHHDEFYWAHGPCCAGCDWWHSLNSRAGECTRRAPVKATERYQMLGFDNCTMRPLPAGHIMTPHDHVCGDFEDKFDWESLPPHYLRQINHPKARTR